MLKTAPKPANSPRITPSPLAEFIRQNAKAIIEEWTNYARVIAPNGDEMTRIALQDHIVDLLVFITEELETNQTPLEQTDKFTDANPKGLDPSDSAAKVHAALRLADGFDMNELIAEYRALRASVVKLWRQNNSSSSKETFDDLVRFNEAIDQVMTDSINHYIVKLDHSRNMFLSILAHDLRNPLGAASMSAQLMIMTGTLDTKQKVLASQIVDCTLRASDIIDDLLDLTRVGFGSDLPISKETMNMGLFGKKLVDEMKASHPARTIILETEGSMEGQWDQIRMGQVFSNLIGNALQYSYKNSAVKITVRGKGETITLSVQNEGPAIPANKIPRIFDALTRGADRPWEAENQSNNLGLGLYITKKIVTAHGGNISVSSSAEDTTFIVELPRT